MGFRLDVHLQPASLRVGGAARARCMERRSQASIVWGERAAAEGDELGMAADDASIAMLIASHSGLAPGERSGGSAIVQGHLTARRKHGVTLAFLDLAWSGHKVQLVVDCDGSEGGHLAPLGSIPGGGGAPAGGDRAGSRPAAAAERAGAALPRHSQQRTPLPAAPPGARRCWLLAATDDAALAISRHQIALRAAGWRVRTSEPALVEALGNKVLVSIAVVSKYHPWLHPWLHPLTPELLLEYHAASLHPLLHPLTPSNVPYSIGPAGAPCRGARPAAPPAAPLRLRRCGRVPVRAQGGRGAVRQGGAHRARCRR
eukprot:scaffold7875_cov59-Phaeocystis_antarctica.AAC.4